MDEGTTQERPGADVDHGDEQPGDLSDLVVMAAAETPDKLALVEADGRSLTWVELDNEVSRLAHGLSSVGVVAGYRVVMVLENTIEFVTTYLAVLSLHAVAVPVNPRSTLSETVRILADSGARLVVADASALETVRAAIAALEAARAGTGAAEGLAEHLPEDLLVRAAHPRLVVVGEAAPGEWSYATLRGAETPGEVPRVRDPERLAVLLYTSGTSGHPRAAMLSHRALLANIDQVGSVRPAMMHGDDVVLGVLPLFHVYGLNAVLGGVLRHRAKLVLVRDHDPETILDVVDDEACSVLPLAPPVFRHWRDDESLAERLGPVRVILSGSAPLDPDAVARFTASTGLAVHQGYGLTEAAPVVTSTLCGDAAAPTPGSVGRALPGIEIRLVEESGQVPEPGDPGEIRIRGANLFSGYWPDGADGPDADGWWSTGDVGLLDPRGELFLVDRVKELVIVSGFNVYPTEVEDVIREVEGVRAAAVIGVADQETGEAVVAYVVAPGADATEVGEAVRAWCEKRLARFKVPGRIEVVDSLPVTGTGKVRKGSLRAQERRRMLELLA